MRTPLPSTPYTFYKLATDAQNLSKTCNLPFTCSVFLGSIDTIWPIASTFTTARADDASTHCKLVLPRWTKFIAHSTSCCSCAVGLVVCLN